MRVRLISFLHGLLVLAFGSLGACQRASYPATSFAVAACPRQLPALVADSQATALVVARPSAPARQEQLPVLGPRLHRTAKLAQVSKMQQVKWLMLPHRQPASAARPARQQARRSPWPPDQPVRYRSRVVAIILASLALTYLPLSLHNFYLGYYGRGVIAIALLALGLYLVAISALGALFGGSMLAISYVGIAILAGWFIWQLSDLIRIISRDLQPKDGAYK